MLMDMYLNLNFPPRTAEEEGPANLFEAGFDPVALLEGLRAHGKDSFEILASRRRRRSSRIVAAKFDEEGFTTEEAFSEEDIGPEPMETVDDKEQPHAATLDDWNDELAEKLGMAPASSRRRLRNKEKWRKRAASKGIQKRKDIPEEVAQKLGQANMAYATSKPAEAITLLLEVVRLAPNLPDPYHTLGLLHEASSDWKKALDFYMIAAHLTPRDISLWRRLANMSTDQGLIRQAVYCYTQILRRDREDLDAKYDRALLYADLEDQKKALEGFEQVQAARPDHPEVPKALARLHYRTGSITTAIDVLRKHIEEHPHQTDLTHINILTELLSEVRDWQGVLGLVEKAENEFLPLLAQQEGMTRAALPIELRLKQGAAWAALGDIPAAHEALSMLLSEPVDIYGDLYVEAGNLLLSLDQPAEALPFLKALAENPVIGTLEDWYRLAECERLMGDPYGAAQIYKTLLNGIIARDHPSYVDALVFMIDLLKEAGRMDEVKDAENHLEEVIEEHGSQFPVGADRESALQFVLKRCAMLRAAGKTELFLELALPSLGATLRDLEREHERGGAAADPALRKRLRYLGRRSIVPPNRNDDADAVFIGYTSQDRRKKHVIDLDQQVEALLLHQQGGGTESEADGDEIVFDVEAGGHVIMKELLRDEEPFVLLVHAIQALLQQRKYQAARELAQAAIDVCGRRWADRSKRDIIRFLCFEACIAERDPSSAVQHLKAACARWPSSNVVWNGYSRLLIEFGGFRAAMKMVPLLRTKAPTSLPLMMASGNCALLSGNHMAGLSEYLHALRLNPQEPLILLSIGAALINKACAKKATNRHKTVLEAFAFLEEYAKQRGSHGQRDGASSGAEVEAAYNMGRAAHALGLHHIAVSFYDKALSIESGSSLKRDAAFNLSLIYNSSGAETLAKNILRQHLCF